jgi:hypothetical protein
MLRLIDIIKWREVSLQSGNSRTVLSFQRGTLAVLRVNLSKFSFTRVIDVVDG